tara:strand:+ start:408 stop:794 length:387 start_codon:yes stop_codon:yes gene_type:complete
MKMNKTLIGGAIAVALYLVFDDEIKDAFSKLRSRFGADGVNTNGDVLIGSNRMYQIPINSGGTDIPVVTPLASPVSGFGSYPGQTAYPMGGAENHLTSLMDGASWMNAASYTNASFGQNYSGRGLGNE